MPDLLKFLNCFQGIFSRSFPSFVLIIQSMLVLADSKNMLSIHRWSGLSYRTIERFFDKSIPWLTLNFILFRNSKVGEKFVLAVDETNVKKSGKSTYGIDLFFCSLLKKSVRSICFLGISIINIETKRSYPLLFSQLVLSPSSKKKAIKPKKNVGRPKGSKNKLKTEEDIAPTFRLLREQLEKIEGLCLPVKCLVGDGKYGNRTVIHLVKEKGFDLVSKLKINSNLYYPSDKKPSCKGRPLKYGKKLDLDNLPTPVKSEKTLRTKTNIYQIKGLLQKKVDCPLNVVIVEKAFASTINQVIFFSTDLEMDYQEILSIYESRFQIEFNFRDAKQHWGLEDFMNTKKERVNNFANLAFFMVNLSQILLEEFRKIRKNSRSGIKDLRTAYRADKYLFEIKKLLPDLGDNIFIQTRVDEYYNLGMIHR